ncbi:MAG: DUF883 family protein [Planctomycetes bacterium]|nr:DUF883 family protein [Planctomycetota bacterium]
MSTGDTSSADQTHRAAAELRQRLADLERDIKALAEAAKAAAREKVSDLRQEAETCREEQRAKIRGVEQSIEQCLTEHPIRAVLTAAGIGFVLGAIWTRR